jgi:hypothetical protein
VSALTPGARQPDATAAYAERLVQTACHFAVRIRDEDPAEVHAEMYAMGTDRLVALASVMAAMIPDDRTPRQLLAWTEPAIRPGRDWAALKAASRAKRKTRLDVQGDAA